MMIKMSTNLSESDIIKLKEIATEKWLIPIWIEKLNEFDKVFSKMVKMITKFDKRITNIEGKLNDGCMEKNK
jgi:hypothetical protein